MNDTSRLITNNKASPILHDRDLTADWYRLTSMANRNLVLPTYCTSPLRCRTISTGWMNGTHPSGNLIIEMFQYPQKYKIILTKKIRYFVI